VFWVLVQLLLQQLQHALTSKVDGLQVEEEGKLRKQGAKSMLPRAARAA
jgi:hypothetical protein